MDATQPEERKPRVYDPKNKVDTSSIEARLFDIIDRIDTASDMYKPKGNKEYHDYVNNQVKLAHTILESDGYDLFYVKEEKS